MSSLPVSACGRIPPLLVLFFVACVVSTGCNCGGSGKGFQSDGGGGTQLGNPDAGAGETSRFPDGGCIGVQCKQVNCPAGKSTDLSGYVYAPNGTLPLYNALVYVPTTAVQPFPAGIHCDRCGAGISGSPLVITLTDATGAFTLKNVPVGSGIPLVYQIGKWRRQVSIPSVAPCVTTPLTSVDLQRLPRNKSEGDIPHIAIATGGLDAMDCLLRKVGVDTAEFTNPDGAGRVHLYTENGNFVPPNSPPASSLWSDGGTLAQYDVVLLPCEGTPNAKPDAGIQNIVDYSSAGGRVFASHFSFVWMVNPADNPFASAAIWTPDDFSTNKPPSPSPFQIDRSFPKGQAFSAWLSNVTALDGGALFVTEPRADVASVSTGTTRWVYTDNNPTNSSPAVEQLTFNTPLHPAAQADGGPGLQCGRVVFSDFHVVSAQAPGPFPDSCGASTDLSPQEKALVFMLFDMSSCIQRDTLTPSVCQALSESCGSGSGCCSGLACLNTSTAAACSAQDSSCVCGIDPNASTP